MEQSPEKIPGVEMTIDLVDQQDQVIGTIKRKNVLKNGENFRTVHVFVFDRSHKLLLQRTSSKHPRSPLKWGSSVAGYLFAGEDYYAGAKRRLKQELGIGGLPIERVGKIPMKDNASLKFIFLFTCVIEDGVHPDKHLIDRVDFLDLTDVERQISTHPEKFTQTFLHVFEYFLDNKGHVQIN